MRDGFADTLVILTEMLTVMELLSPFLVKLYQLLFSLVPSNFLGEEALKKEKHQKPGNPILNRVVESPDTKEKDVGHKLTRSQKSCFTGQGK